MKILAGALFFFALTNQVSGECSHRCKTFGPVGPFTCAPTEKTFDFGKCDVQLIHTKFACATRFPYLRFFDEHDNQLPKGDPVTWRGTKGEPKIKHFDHRSEAKNGPAPTFNKMTIKFRDSYAKLLEFEVCGYCDFSGPVPKPLPKYEEPKCEVPREPLDPLTIPKYVTPLVIPPVLYDDKGYSIDVDVALRQFTQQVLPQTGCKHAQMTNPDISCKGDAFPGTTLWGYGNPQDKSTFNNPSFTIEVTKDVKTRVQWINELVDECGNFLPHIVQDKDGTPIIDQTLHWAAPNQDCIIGEPRTDCRGNSSAPYRGPVPMVTHVHGAHVGPGSDGYPEAWWLPDAKNIPDGFATEGRFFDSADGADNARGKGYAIDEYTNDQPTTTLWYHDHTLGITRLNVYGAGAGFWLIRDKYDGETGLLYGKLPGPPPKLGDDPNGKSAVRNKIREIPIAIQPKSFYSDGSQFYPADRANFEGLGDGTKFKDNTNLNIPFLPNVKKSDIAPAWNPEVFLDSMVVNGNTWPVLEVAPERYRFRLLNAADSRFLNLFLQVDGTDVELPFYQIGAEQSLLPKVVRIETGFATPLPGDGRDVCTETDTKNCIHRVPHVNDPIESDRALLMGPAERADVIVDFSVLKPGSKVIMYNTGPDSPYGGFPIEEAANPETTGQVMKFIVGNGDGTPDDSTPPKDLVLDYNPGGEPKLGYPNAFQDLALLEEESKKICVETIEDENMNVIKINQVEGSPEDMGGCPPGSDPFGPQAAVLGVDGSKGGVVQLWDDPVDQLPKLDTVEVWDLWNWSADAHPIHLHLVKFEVVSRTAINNPTDTRGPDANEQGWKDMVTALPGEVTRIKAKFDVAGLYVWHCHVLSHEDNEMMVPYCVIDPSKPYSESCPDVLFEDPSPPMH